MNELYLEVFSEIDENGLCSAPLETVISLFTYKYCDCPPVFITFVISTNTEERAVFHIQISDILFEIFHEKEISDVAKLCKLPVVVYADGASIVAGLCAVLRQVIKISNPKHFLLGFKQSCLYACAEVSQWTKFCEVDIINTVNSLYSKKQWKSDGVEIPEDVARFEVHLSHPVKIHNIEKEKQDLARSQGLGRNSGPIDNNLYAAVLLKELSHDYSEGHKMTLADIMLLPSFHIIFEFLGSECFRQHVPLLCKWYRLMLSDSEVSDALKIFVELQKPFEKEMVIKYNVPVVGKQSLYKGMFKKYQPKRQFFTRQEEILECFHKINSMEGLIDVGSKTFGAEIDFDWTSVPSDFHLDESQIPAKRLERKSQQLQNMTKAVLKIARNGDHIVDFCSGSGHLGLILAHALPRCRIILLENKEQSLTRAKLRAANLNLLNVIFCQSNVDYFKGRFDIGVSLHACGVATDLVMERCIQQQAAFVCCPCCYGSIQPNHIISYPRSEVFRNSDLTPKEYLILGHASDQTHDESNVKTDQGYKCMAIIDCDRCLRAKDVGYSVFLSKFDPPTCTPKNNLLVGVPAKRNQICD